MKYLAVLLFLLFLSIEAICQEQSEQLIFFNNLENASENKWENMHTITEGDAFSGKYFSRTNAENPYGLGYKTYVPSLMKGKNFILNIHAWCRTDNINNPSSIIITVSIADSVIFWKSIDLKKFITSPQKWYEIKDSFLFPASIAEKAQFLVFLWNNGALSNTDIDDMEIKFQKALLPSFLINTSNFKTPLNNNTKELFSNNFYFLFYSENEGQILIKGKNEAPIISELILYRCFKLSKENKIDSSFINKFSIEQIKKNPDSISVILKCNDKTGFTNITLCCHEKTSAIDFKTETSYEKNTEIFRESLILQFEKEVRDVYRKNTIIDTSDFQQEYWLDKEGVKFGNGSSSAYIYHSPDISSLQLNTLSKQLIVNLDYYKDHPLIQFPVLDSACNKFIDISSNLYHNGEKIKNNFTIYIGFDYGNFPRLMKNPDGFLASYVWTEHADWTDIRTHRAVYFGSEKITEPDSAQGGFVKYKIPVTKSVFFCNPDSINNSMSSAKSNFKSSIASLQDTPDFIDFISSLYLQGNDICMHTPSQYTDNRLNMQKALSFMQKHFNSKTWIDHGYDNAQKNNRENMLCDGLNKNSQHYSRDLWEKYGIKYFWNSFFEDKSCYSDYNFSNMLSSPYIGFGDMFPTSDFWQHQSRSGLLYHWKTLSPLDVKGGTLWKYFFNNTTLQDLVNNRDMVINHCYPASTNTNNGFWLKNDSGIIVANPLFNKTLELMHSFALKGLINFTTVSALLDYRTSLDSVIIKPVKKNEFIIINKGAKNIKGLSIALQANEVFVNGEIPQHKQNKGDIIFWFDLAPKQSKIISAK